MRLILTNTGSYPRIGDAPDAQRHRRAYARRERGELSEAEWRAVEDEVTREVIAEQVGAGVELPTDGQVRWYDPISHLARPLANVTVNGLLRYFDTNFYFRQPVVRGAISRSAPVLLPEFEVGRAAAAPRELATLAAARGPARLACYTYFGDALPLYDDLQALPVDVLGLDFTYSPKLAVRIAEAGSAKVLGLGLVDGRNTKLESRETIFPVLDRVLPRLGDTAYLNPSCGLEFLPRERARAKLETMVRLAGEYAGRGGA